MSASIKRIGAIFIKELQDIKTNVNIIFMYAIPILFVVIYDNFLPGMPQGFALAFSLLFLGVLVGMYVPSMLISEEKEKKTIQVLMLSPARPAEVFAGKGLLTFASMLLVTLIMMLISKNGFSHTAVILTATTLLGLMCIFIGMAVGLLAPNQMATGAIGFPLYMILIMIPLFAIIGVTALEKIGSFLPTYHYFKMLELAFTKSLGLGDMLKQLAILAGGSIAAFVILLLVYRKKGLD